MAKIAAFKLEEYFMVIRDLTQILQPAVQNLRRMYEHHINEPVSHAMISLATDHASWLPVPVREFLTDQDHRTRNVALTILLAGIVLTATLPIIASFIVGTVKTIAAVGVLALILHVYMSSRAPQSLNAGGLQ